MAAMSSERGESGERGERVESGDEATTTFEMPQPIPPYLFAFAVGEYVARELSPRSRVWAEPALVEAAACEFGERRRRAAASARRALFGPYDWERFDILIDAAVVPVRRHGEPAADVPHADAARGRSLARERGGARARALVDAGTSSPNASAEHFWLNEGFTVFAERRIVEALDGAEMARAARGAGPARARRRDRRASRRSPS